MILVAGLSPAWQQIMEFSSLNVGEVNRAQRVTWCASGKVLNVGIALQNLSGQNGTCSEHLPLVLSAVGGWSGRAIHDDMQQQHVRAEWLPLETSTRVCTTILDRSTEQTTELVENASAVPPGIAHKFQERVRELSRQARVLVLTGSLPAQLPNRFYAEILQDITTPTLLDFRGPELLACLPHRPTIVKPNREELAQTVGRALHSEEDVLAAMRELNEQGAQWVIVTAGAGAILVSSLTENWRIEPPLVTPVINPIGCGDCLAAGLALGLSRGVPLKDALQTGIRAAADNVRQLLPARCGPA